jgi:hypothetical protein
MQKKTWYAIVLLLPLLPIVLAFIFGPVFIPVLGSVLFFASLIACVPYLAFYIGVLLWMRKKTADEVKRASWHFPWVFAIICGIFWTVAPALQNADRLFKSPGGVLFIVGLCIPFGYMYVALAHGLTRLIVSLRWIKS